MCSKLVLYICSSVLFVGYKCIECVMYVKCVQCYGHRFVCEVYENYCIVSLLFTVKRDYSQLTLTQAKRLEMESQVINFSNNLHTCSSSTGTCSRVRTRVSRGAYSIGRAEEGPLSSWRITRRMGRHSEFIYFINLLYCLVCYRR